MQMWDWGRWVGVIFSMFSECSGSDDVQVSSVQLCNQWVLTHTPQPTEFDGSLMDHKKSGCIVFSACQKIFGKCFGVLFDAQKQDFQGLDCLFSFFLLYICAIFIACI